MTTARFVLSSDSAADLLEAFLHREETACRDLPTLAAGPLHAMARRLARDLPKDLLGEVVNEMWVLVVGSRVRFDRTRATAAGFLGLFMKNALRLVRARYAATGVSKRVASRRRMGQVSDVALEDREEVVTSLPDPTAHTQMEARAEANEVLDSAEPRVRQGLWLVYVDGYSTTEAAERVGTSRFTLSRAFDRFTRARLAA